MRTQRLFTESYDRCLQRYQELVRLGDERGLTGSEFAEIVNQVGLESDNRDKSGLAWRNVAGRYWPAWWR